MKMLNSTCTYNISESSGLAGSSYTRLTITAYNFLGLASGLWAATTSLRNCTNLYSELD
jgi:hypothetical protein